MAIHALRKLDVASAEVNQLRDEYLSRFSALRKENLFSVTPCVDTLVDTIAMKYFNTEIEYSHLLFLPNKKCMHFDQRILIIPIFSVTDTLIVCNHVACNMSGGNSVYIGDDIGIVNTGVQNMSVISVCKN